MKTLNSKLLKKFLESAVQKLTGEWVLVGGTLLPAVGIDVRATVDIDFIGLGAREASQGLELMQIAEDLGLPVESVNQAAAFFMKKIGYAKSDLILLKESKKCVVYRPSLDLYWRLKCARLSETDLEDCRHYFRYCLKHDVDLDLARTRSWLDKRLAKRSETPEILIRLQKLKDISFDISD